MVRKVIGLDDVIDINILDEEDLSIRIDSNRGSEAVVVYIIRYIEA